MIKEHFKHVWNVQRINSKYLIKRETNKLFINKEWNDVTYRESIELVIILLDGLDFQRQPSQIFSHMVSWKQIAWK